MEIDYKTIGESIKRQRKASGLTGEQLGDRVNLDRQKISAYETGRIRIPVDVLVKIADALEVTINDLIAPTEAQTQINIQPAVNEAVAQYAEKSIYLSDEEFTVLSHLRDMPQEIRQRLVRTINLAWADQKGIL